ncbi:hypothetical protein PoB_003259300 [Plakobranchus ocellatus]|uniref:Uncharacterized protein n=1 Tax=Plakobranchus ocellatus TaxID=259542 RepID=A0AAV4AHS9_9GAST|nr:hypothetical protein PoB_003259300 [Plakobranchus ocellatus]
MPLAFSKETIFPPLRKVLPTSTSASILGSSCWSLINCSRSTPTCLYISGTRNGLVTASRFTCALVVAAPTITDMSGSSGLLAPSMFPTMTSQMASGMHNAFTSPLRKGVLKLMTAFSANSAVLSILSSRQHSQVS